MPNVIEIKGLGKKYIIRHQGAQNYSTLRDQMSDMFWNCFKIISNPTSLMSKKNHKREEFWALKDITFPVQQGERIGIIGKNGAGKSTLLKILSRITQPTEGTIRIRGRVTSLLEVGTGFHLELTGRENIFLNGAILGMSRSDIKYKFDEIVAFSGIDKFLDTPVKRYSSGMFVRLAFAVAAHLEPDILIVDEVLSVGDAEFQKKCLGKMKEVSKEGRTVLFVSHNMNAIQSLCTKGIVLNNGRIESIGNIGEAIHHYQNLVSEADLKGAKQMRGIKILSVRFSSASNANRVTPNSSLCAEVDFYTEYNLSNCYWNFVIEDSEGRYIVHSRTDQQNEKPIFIPGIHRVDVNIPRLCIRAGVYTLWFRLFVSTGDLVETVDSDPIMLEVSGPQVSGYLDIPCKWSWRHVSMRGHQTQSNLEI